MSLELYVTPANEDDVRFVANNMRQEDIEEAGALGLLPLDALLLSYYHAKVSYTLREPDGTPCAVLGASPGQYAPTWGAVWLLGTKGMSKHPKTVIKNSKQALDLLFEQSGYEVLYNYTYAENRLHHSWLRWLGFHFLREVNLPPFNKEFIEFVKLRN